MCEHKKRTASQGAKKRQGQQLVVDRTCETNLSLKKSPLKAVLLSYKLAGVLICLGPQDLNSS
jgi:hypothetical protein